jgi:Alcohol dehydrogenase GroES-like domain
MNATITPGRNEAAGKLQQTQSAADSGVQSSPSLRAGTATDHKAWVAKAPKQPMVLKTADLGPLEAEDVEVAVEHCGVCHSDVSVSNNEWDISQYPAILGQGVVGRGTGR